MAKQTKPAPKAPEPEPRAVVDDGMITLHLYDGDELTEQAEVRVPREERPFQIGHGGVLYQQSRPELDGSWIYRHLTK